MDSETWGRLAYLIVLLALVGGWVVVEYRNRLGSAMRSFLAWGLIFLAVMVGYALWSDMRSQIGPGLIAPAQSVTAQGTLEIPRAPDGHYYPVVEVNGTPITFMADTGASSIVLGSRDAARLGIDSAALVYLGRAQTANGMVRTARVTLDSLTLGPFQDSAVTAYVTDGEMEGSLLGMDYLGLFRIEIDRDRMILSR
jgi:aspartyl protease family protein